MARDRLEPEPRWCRLFLACKRHAYRLKKLLAEESSRRCRANAMLKGKLLRLGKDWWTTFTTGADLEIGGKPLAAGSYLLALSCDADGKFALAVLDAAKGMKGGALPWPDRSGKRNWEPDLLIPLEHSKDAANRSDKLTIALLANGEDLQNGKLQLHWGPHQLTAKLAVHAGKK
jgi:hypothetical protein